MIYFKIIIIYIIIQLITDENIVSDIFKSFLFILFIISRITFINLILSIILITILEQIFYKNKVLESIFRPKELVIEEGVIKLNKRIDLLNKYNIDISTIRKGYFNKKNNLIMITGDIKYPVPIIIEGKLLYNNLKNISKDLIWLNKILDNNSIEIEKIRYSYYQCNKLYIELI